MMTEVLFTLPSSVDAHLIKNRLENEGIDCFLVNENFSNLVPYYFNLLGAGVQIVCKKEDLERAREIIKVNEEKIVCPCCRSNNIRAKSEKSSRKLALMFISIILTGLIGNLITDFECLSCKTEFRK